MSDAVKVGQVYRRKRGGSLFTVTSIDSGGSSVYGVCEQHRDDGSHPTDSHYTVSFLSKYYTLAQDVPAVVDWTAGGRWKPQAVCAACWRGDDVYGPHEDDCQWVVVYLEANPGVTRGELGRVESAQPTVDPCQALRASLPVSGEFVEGCANQSYEACSLVTDAGHHARADLRSKVSTLRAWPCCPTSKQPLSISASVRLQEKDHLGLNLGSKRWEYLRVWTATFTCPSCGGGK